MSEKRKRKFGDRKDGYWVKDVTGLQTIMGHIMPSRTEAEVWFNDDFDITNLLKYIEKKNAEHPNYKTTVFHCVIFAIAKMINERPKMNRFIQGRRTYQRETISMSFMAKRRFKDDAEEKFMVLVPKDNDTLDTISHKIYGDITEARKSEHSEKGSFDNVVNTFAKIPRPILMAICRTARYLDFWGKNLDAFMEGDSNYTTCLLTNLGSIKCKSIYHHLNNYGTNSFMVAVGLIHKKEVVLNDGSKKIIDALDIGATLDERIADGFYMARSLKLVQYILENPEIMDRPFNEPTGYKFEDK